MGPRDFERIASFLVAFIARPVFLCVVQGTETAHGRRGRGGQQLLILIPANPFLRCLDALGD